MALFDLPLPELERYLPELDEPADFDEFWASTLAEARTFDLGADRDAGRHRAHGRSTRST